MTNPAEKKELLKARLSLARLSVGEACLFIPSDDEDQSSVGSDKPQCGRPLAARSNCAAKVCAKGHSGKSQNGKGQNGKGQNGKGQNGKGQNGKGSRRSQAQSASIRARVGPAAPVRKVKSLYSTIQYAAKRRGSDDAGDREEELRPSIPAPWTRLGTFLRANAPNGPKDSEVEVSGSEALEHELLLETISSMLPADPIIREYFDELRKTYFAAKTNCSREIRFRERFKNKNFQALVSDYLSDTQMQRDRGEMTESIFQNAVANVQTLLFGGQLEVQGRLETTVQELETLHRYCLAIRTGESPPDLKVAERLDALKEPSCESFYLKTIKRFMDPKDSIHGGKQLALHFDLRWDAEKDQYKLFDGVLHIRKGSRNYDERMRLTRALDQRVAPCERLFEGKITSFTEARLTDCDSHGDLDRKLLKSNDPIVHYRASDSESDGPAEAPDMEQATQSLRALRQAYENQQTVKLFEPKDRSPSSMRRTRYVAGQMASVPAHLLFGKVRKFKEEEVCYPEDSPFYLDDKVNNNSVAMSLKSQRKRLKRSLKIK